MTRGQIETALNRALDTFVERAEHFVAAAANERSMSHRIAVDLEQELPGYEVACEYKRDGFDVNRLEAMPHPPSPKSDEAVRVFPDIIVHRRGSNDHNWLVLDMKQAAAGTDPPYDLHKLHAFQRELHDAWAVHLHIGRLRNGPLVRTTHWTDG